MLMLLIAGAFAGNAEVEVVIGDRTATVEIDHIASCAPTRLSFEHEDVHWEIGVTAARLEGKELWLEVDVNMTEDTKKDFETAELRPSFLTTDGEVAELSGQSGDDLLYRVTAKAEGIEPGDLSCVPSQVARRIRDTRSRQ